MPKRGLNLLEYTVIGIIGLLLYGVDAVHIGHGPRIRFLEYVPVLNVPYLLAGCFGGRSADFVMFGAAFFIGPALTFCGISIFHYLTNRWSQRPTGRGSA